MASTFSPTLRLELIGDGDQSGIWGQTTNNNLGGLLEQAITGVITIGMVDANYTMSNFNGVVDEARNQVLVLTGALSAQRNLIAPLVEKTYTIRNTTTGGFGVQIIGSSGTGVIIPNGTTASVFCDGTNFFPATTGSLGNQVINGNLLVTGTTTLVGALGASTATFSGAISSVNPTFTGTPTAPTAPSGTNTTQIATTAFVQGIAGTLGTMSTQNANAVAITGGTINGTTIGATTAASIAGTTGNFSGNLASLGSVSGTSGIFGAVSGTTGTFSGAVSGTTGTFSGAVSGASGAFGAVSGTTATFSSLGTFTGGVLQIGASSGTYRQFRFDGTMSSDGSSFFTILNASNFNVYSPTLTGGGASGTWNINVSGNAVTTSQTNFSNLTIGGSQVLAASNFNSYAPTLTGGNASGTWNINITGTAANATNAANATQAANATAVNGASSNGFGNRTVSTSAPSGGSNGDIWYRV
jgi:hypothetical protein